MSIKKLIYNLAQLAFIVSVKVTKAKVFILEWGRGTGKSTIIGRHIYDCVCQMPRSTGGLVGATYAQIKTRTLPSTIQGLEQHGVYKDQHYVIGKLPPKEWNWPSPYQSILDPTNCIFWWNGTVTVFISLDGGASSGRGLNLDWGVGDEAALFDKEKFATDVDLTIRGNRYQKAHYPDGTFKFYKDCRLHHSLLLATSTPLTTEGMWILEYEDQARANPDKVQFLRASAVVNILNLGKDFFERSKASMPDFLYEAEVLNKRVRQIRDGFYPKFNERLHTYQAYDNQYYKDLPIDVAPTCLGDSDLIPEQSLHLAMDWGTNINCMIVSQVLPDELRILKNFYVLAPKILDDVIKDHFIPYYAPHRAINNKIYLYYDPSGNIHTANSRLTFAQQAAQLLRQAGWDVITMTRGTNNESHEKKYRLCLDLFGEASTKYPKIRMNSSNCRELIISMKNSPAKKGARTAIQKDKKSERNKKVQQQHATHFSDTFDILVVSLYMKLLNPVQTVIETRTM